MVPALLAAVLWQASDALSIPNSEARTVELPALRGPAVLAFRARADFPRRAGSSYFLHLVLNGQEVGRMRDRRTPRLLNKPATFTDGGLTLSWYAFGRWRVAYAPGAEPGDEFVLDVSDLLNSHAPNVLVFENGPLTTAGPTPLVIEALRLERGPRAMPPPPSVPDWRTPRLRLRSPPHFAAEADDDEVRVRWPTPRTASGSEIGGPPIVTVRTTVTGGPHRRERTIVLGATHVAVRDTFVNESDTDIGLRVRHAVATQAAWIHLGGRPDPEVTDGYSPWNPTVFTPLPKGGIGLVAEDDVFRQQLQVDFRSEEGTVGLRTDMLCLPPGDRVTLEWSIYPTRTRSYWDFINTVREDWGVNRTIPGSYIWFRPENVLAMAPDALAAALARQGVEVASMLGGWLDLLRPEQPPHLGFGADVLADGFADYRSRIRAAVEKLKTARPGLRVLLYFDTQRDSATDAVLRFADSLLVDAQGQPERIDWGGRFSPAWGMVPTKTNSFGVALGAVPEALRALGADGLYWDEIDGVDFEHPRVTWGVWDGRSCIVTPQGQISARIGLANLLSQEVKLAYVDDTLMLGNGPPTTRRFQTRPDLRMVEAHHNNAWGAFAHLTTPLGYIGGARRDFTMVVEKIEEGLLVAGTRLDYPYTLPARLFPFTPEYIQPGTLRGRERIVTTRSGLHGWLVGGGHVHALRYDAAGVEHEADGWHRKERRGRAMVRVRLAPGEVALLERLP